MDWLDIPNRPSLPVSEAGGDHLLTSLLSSSIASLLSNSFLIRFTQSRRYPSLAFNQFHQSATHPLDTQAIPFTFQVKLSHFLSLVHMSRHAFETYHSTQRTLF